MMYSSYGASASMASASIWIIVSAVIAVIGGICVYFCFLTKENENKLTGFLKWLYEFLSFKKLFAEVLLKICYIIVAIFITLSSFAVISTSFVSFVLALVIGNVLLRVGYEFLLTILLICSNVTEINSKLKSKAVEKKEKEN